MEGLHPIRPADKQFTKLLSYRTYRLDHLVYGMNDSSATRIKRATEQLKSYLKPPFDGSDPIMVLSFLALFTERCNLLSISENEAFHVLPMVMAGNAEALFRSTSRLTGSSVHGVTDWPTAVQFLLRVYTKDEHISEAVQHLRNLRQERTETVMDYFGRFEHAHTRAGGYLPEDQMMNTFLDGLDDTTRNRCRMYARGKKNLNIIELIEFAQAEDSALRAIYERVNPRGMSAKASSSSKTGKGLGAIGESPDATEATSSIATSIHEEYYNLLNPEQVVAAVGQFSRKGMSRDAPMVPSRVPGQPGWVDNKTRADRPVKEDVVCWRCYARGSHYASTCVFDIVNKAPVVKTQFEMLTHSDKMLNE